MLLKASISENVDVVLWLPIEFENNLNIQELTTVCKMNTDVEIWIMVKTLTYKNRIKQFVMSLGISEVQILDIYAVYNGILFQKKLSENFEIKKNEVFDGFVFGETQKMGELMIPYNAGGITEETISGMKYLHLGALLDVLKGHENGQAFYVKVKNQIETIAVNKIKKKKKITVGFMANYSSTWIGNSLYHLFEESERYEPYVILLANHYGMDEHYKNITKKEYKEEVEKFKKYPVRLIQTMDWKTGREFTWDELGVRPELLIWLSPWVHAFGEYFHLYNFPLDVLHTYIPYSFMLADNEQGNYTENQYNYVMHNITWKNFEGSFKDLEMAEKYAFVGASNAVYVGCPKMDSIYGVEIEEEDIWSEVEKKHLANKEKKRIIFAPHHSLENSAPINFSTFASNYQLMLNLAEEYQKETVWVMRPHPQLKMRALATGLFRSEEEWSKYLQKWNSLSNATVMQGGSYMKLFKESDAMIDDSVSYLAEYLYADKPLLFLTGNRQAFNDFGMELVKIHYSVAGDDEMGIREFIEKVVIKKEDKKEKLRKNYFDKNLNYMESKRCLAAESIFNIISEALAE